MNRKSHFINALKGFVYFSALAPALGSLTFSLPVAVYAMIARPEPKSLLVALALILGIGFWSYLIGFLPAAITGSIVGLFRQRLSSWKHYSAAGILGVVVSCIAWYLIRPENVTPPSALTSELGISLTSFATVLLFLGLPSFIGGTLAARIFGGRSNYAIKGTSA